MRIKIFHAVICLSVCLACWEFYSRDTCNRGCGINSMGFEECVTAQHSDISKPGRPSLNRLKFHLPVLMDMEMPVHFGLFVRDNCYEHRIFRDAVKTCNLS